MKTFFVSIVFVFLTTLSVFAQRFAYADSEYILKHIPDYLSAQKQLDALSQQWQKEIDNSLSEIDKLSKTYQADQVLLTDEMRKRRESEIAEKEKSIKEFQSAKFGVGGELYQQRIKLIRPIQDKVAKATQLVAESQQLDFIFDKAEFPLLYGNPRYDKSNDVLTRMGIKPGVIPEK
jgi:outer membrane protein